MGKVRFKFLASMLLICGLNGPLKVIASKPTLGCQRALLQPGSETIARGDHPSSPTTPGVGQKPAQVIPYPKKDLEILTDQGFIGRDYYQIFLKAPQGPVAEGQWLAQSLKEYLDLLSEEERLKLRARLSLAESQFLQYYTTTAQLELLLLKIALDPGVQSANWIEKVQRKDTSREELIKVGTFIKSLGVLPREVALQSLIQKYPLANKYFSSATPPLEWKSKLPPRRALTYLFKILTGGFQELGGLVPTLSRHSDQKSEYRAHYLRYLNQVSAIAAQMGRGWGQLPADLILGTVEILRVHFLEHANKLSNAQDPDLKLIIFGSFVNGLAKEGVSDIDLLFQHPILSGFSNSARLKKDLDSLYRSRGFYQFPFYFENAMEKLQRDGRSLGEIGNQLSAVNGIAIRISYEKTELLIYPLPTYPQVAIEPWVIELDL